MSFKPENQGGDGPQLDYAGVNKTVIEQEEMYAFISLNVDLGIQKAKESVSYGENQQTVVDTEEEAEELIEKAIDIMGEYLMDKHNLDEMPDENDDGKFELPFEIYTPKDCQQVAVFLDAPECEVEYIEDQPVQYRHMLNRSFAGEINGINFKAAPPTGKGSKLWTFSPKSTLYDLAVKSGHKEIVSEGNANMDIDLWLGAPVRLDVEEKNGYPRISISKIGKREVKAAEEVREQLEVEPTSIMFTDDVDDLVEKLEAAQLRFGIIKLIKAATNYAGSNMEKALDIIKAKQDAKSDQDDDDDVEDKPKSKKKAATKKKDKKAKTKPKKKAKKSSAEDDNNDGGDDESPF